MKHHYDVAIIGGGQAGLAMGYHLARRGLDFIILDANARTGETWRNRWDSLTLFTPAKHSALPGARFPADGDHLPTKDEVADYLEGYARHYDLPIRFNERVVELKYLSEWNGFIITTGTNTYQADQVVVATGPFQTPVVPSIASRLGRSVVQMHSSAYRNPEQLPRSAQVLVVGGGNSGVQIAAEIARTRPTAISIGAAMPALPTRIAGRSIFSWLDTLGVMDMPVTSRMGRRASRSDVLIGKSVDVLAREHGIERIGRVDTADGTTVITKEGNVMEVDAVIWATGFKTDYTWIDAPVFNDAGQPIHVRGVTPARGLYFLGLPWQHTRGSALLGWVGRDAAYLAERISR